MKTRLSLALCILVALCGCDNISGKRTATGTSFRGKDYSLTFPSSWTVLNKGPMGVDLMGVSPSEGQGDFQENVNVVLENVPPGMSDQEYLDASIKVLKKGFRLPNDLISEETKVGNQKGYHLNYSFTMQGVPLDNDLYVVIHDGGSYIITCSHAKGKREAFKKTVDGIIKTFRIKE